ncbi:hypothetical protein Tco_1095274 [Tanacetum coccineum]
MTRSSNKELFTPYEEPERVLHSTKKLFMTKSLDYSSSPKFDLFSDLEDQCEEEVTKAMREPTMEEYVTITRIDCGSGSARPRIELKGQFLFELRDNAFSGTNKEDAIETNGANNKVKWDPTNIEFNNWLALKFRNHEMMDQYTKNTLWDYWKRRDDEEVITDNELSDPRDDNLIKENKIAQIFRINTDRFDEHEFMEDDDDDIGDLEDYLIRKEPPYYVNDEE